jgi:type IV pilus assembly protein PilA
MQQTSGKAIGSLICGIINVFPLFIVAIILGHLSLSEIRKSAGRLKGEGMAIAGLILGYLGLVFVPIILIIAAIAIPNILRAKIAANESSAVRSVRMVITSEVAYSTSNPTVGYTCNLADLVSAGLLDQELSSAERYGYRFSLQNCEREADGAAVTKFQITAVPVARNQSGVRAFCADERGVVLVDESGSGDTCLANGSPLQ